MTRDRTLLACAGGLFVAGLLAWWLLPAGGRPVGLGIGSLLAIWLSAAGLIAAVWHLGQQPASKESYVAPLALAATAPLSAVPFLAWPHPLPAAVGLTVAAVASLPLGLVLSVRIAEAELSKRVAWTVVTCVSSAVVVGWITAGTTTAADLAAQAMGAPSAGLAARSGLLTFALAMPAGMAAWSVLREAEAGMSTQARILVALGLTTAGTVPIVTGIALLTPVWQIFAVPLFAAAAMAIVLARVAIGPLARAAGSAIVQRDLVVAAAEAERARLASALHDGPLGDITLLVQRLDQSGDVDNAAIARSIATDLRSIGNELQLPILEDLGAGPALEWLVDRLSWRSGAEVELEMHTRARPPAQVELAIYRIAQEALVNAIKHGRPPVRIRYDARPDLVSLSVHDAGSGLDRAAPARAQREGRLGLLSMSQRAESIGARLVMAASPGGGTHVELEWTPAAG